MKLKRFSIALLVLVFLASLLPLGHVQAATTISFTAEELLGSPEDTSIAVNIVPASTIEYHYQYGTTSGVYTMQTPDITATGGQPSEVVIGSVTPLTPDTHYYYRMQYHLPGETDWVNRGEHSFWTQRAEGSTFAFTVTSDSHAQYNSSYQQTIQNVISDEPDFHFDLGDTFMLDGDTSQSQVNTEYLAQRSQLYLGGVGSSAPIFLSSGNHEDEEGWNLDDTPFSIAQASIQARKLYFPTPIDDGFYSGNTDILAAINATTYGDQYREDYYAFEWGDALFVVIDPYQYTMTNPYGATAGEGSDDPASGDSWNWTLGQQQYLWLKNVLESSDAKYKFVFAHHVVGGMPSQTYVRGGAEAVPYYEWGGYNWSGTYEFDTKRPGWDEPIEQLFIENGVSAFFHGHDHEYAYEVRDGIVYQEVPSPSMSGYGFGLYSESGTYTLKVLPSTGHLRITVSPTEATVAYVRSNVADEGYTYTILPNAESSDPTINVTGTLTAFTSAPGTPSSAQSYTVSGTNLTGDITVTPPADFQLSLNGTSGWTSSPLTLARSGGNVPTTTIYVRFSRATAGTSTGNITNASAGATTRNVAVSGTATNSTPITFTGAELLGRPEASSISVSVVPDSAIQLYYEYGTISGTYPEHTSTIAAPAGQSAVVKIEGLTTDTRYYYRMQYSTDGGSSWIARPEHSFWTQRAEGSTFTFDITSDGHVNIMLGNENTWTNTLNDVADDHPDFAIDLGDTVAMDDVDVGDISGAEAVYQDVLSYFNIVSASSPVFLVPGNHEQTEGWHLTAANTGGNPAISLPVIGTNAMKEYFLNPEPDAFYSGDTGTYTPLGGNELRQDYYAFEWGDALFVVIDPFWFTTTKPYTSDPGGGESDTTGSGDSWDWTLGLDQFNWLKDTLENSTAKYKFVFAHQMVGGGNISGQSDYGHGGANYADLCEWGGYNENGTTWGWDTHRDVEEWGSQPVHQIMVASGVTAFFHGHDHQYAYEMLDGIVYQSVPAAGFTGNGFSIYSSGSGNTIQALSSSGHLRVTVSPTEATVEYIRTSASTSAYTYTMLPNTEPEPGAITLDGPVSNGTGAANASSASISHTTGTGLDRLMLVGVSWNCGSTGRTISSVTFTPSGGSATPLALVKTQQAGTQLRYTAIYSLLDPPAGVTGTVTVTFSGSVSNGIVIGVANFAGVDQANPLGTPAGAPGSSTSSTSPSVTLTGLNGDELVFDTVFQGASDDTQTLTAGDGQTGLWTNFVSNTRAASSTEQAAGSEVTMSWTAASASYWAIAAVPINPAASNPVAPSFNIILGIPTDVSVTVNVIPDQTGEAYIEYGSDSGVYTGETGHFSCTVDEPVEVLIGGSLSSDTGYYYRIRFQATGATAWSAGEEYSFHTQRAPGDTFTFTIISDSHLGQYGGNTEGQYDLYEQTLLNVLADNPDFHIDLGDTFPMDPQPLGTGMTEAEAEAAYLTQRYFMNLIGSWVPIFYALGNHENEEGWNFDDTFPAPDVDNLALLSMKYRKLYYPHPIPDGSFYTGNLDDSLTVGDSFYREDYYAWEWGDALFVVLDPYEYSMTWPNDDGAGYGGEGQDGEVSGDRWDWTLGIDQYLWFKNVLETSTARYKFVFSHQVTGGETPYGRGGISAAPYFEWGGYNADGTWGWDTERPAAEGWDVPIHQLMVENGVNIFFHGHDHIFACEELDGIVYLECPKPDDDGYDWEPFGYGYTEDLYPDALAMIPNSGHIRVTVSPGGVTVDYVRSYLPGDGTNGEVAYSLTVLPASSGYGLTVNTEGNGSVSLDPVGGTYNAGTEVELTASADPGWTFDHWSGDLSGSDNPATIIIDGDKSVTATFTQNEYTLTINTVGNGAVERDIAGPYHYGDIVELTASADPGWTFSAWSGDLTGTNNPDSVTMNDDMSVTVTFTRNEYTLTVNTVGNGIVERDIAGPYHYGDIVHLTATPAVDWKFSTWSGDLSGSVNPAAITMEENKVVTASFVLDTFAVRELPAGVTDNTTFQVVIRFTAPADGFNSIGVSDIAPAGWVVTADKTWCAPAATENNTPAINKVEYVWFASYTTGTEFTVVYNVTVPAGTAPGVYSFPGGQVEYYIGGDGPFTVPIGGDSEVSWGSVISGVVAGADGTLLPGATVEIYLDDVLQDTATSDVDGQYELVATETGEYTVVASAPGFRDETQAISVPSMDTGYTLDFIGNHGLIPEAPDMSYVLACVNKWLYPPAEHPEMALSMSKVLAVVNAWLYPGT